MYKSDEQSRKKEELSQSGQHEDVDSPDNYPKVYTIRVVSVPSRLLWW